MNEMKIPSRLTISINNNNDDNNEYHETVGEFTTLKTTVGGAQPIKIVHMGGGGGGGGGAGESNHSTSSEDLARHIAQRKTGNPDAYERAPIIVEEEDETIPRDENRSGSRIVGDDRGQHEPKGKVKANSNFDNVVVWFFFFFFFFFFGFRPIYKNR